VVGDPGSEILLQSREDRRREHPPETTTVQGQDLEVITTFGDYKTVEGLTIAHSMENHVKGKESMGGQALNFTKIEMNPKVDKAIFAMPAAAAAPKPETKKAQ
jgi:hypothetical protein